LHEEVNDLPNIKSAIKRVKVNTTKNLRNRRIKSATKTSLKKFDVALRTDPSAATALLAVTSGAVDRAAAKGVIHKNAANRKKARLARALNKAAAAR
jgi:small subunit ribosomal protein S20